MLFPTVFWSNLLKLMVSFKQLKSNFEREDREKSKQLLRLRSFSGCLYKKKCIRKYAMRVPISQSQKT